MPLADLQSALATLVSDYAAAGDLTVAAQDSLHRSDLTEAERDWLRYLPATQGFKVTCDIQRWWRETRLRGVARLTLAALGSEQTTQILNEFLSTHPCVSLFFLPESLAFLNYVAGTVEHPHPAAIARFERALIIAKEAASQAEQTSDTQATTIIEFASPPEELLAALLQNRELPEPGDARFPVIVASFLPHFWQPVSSAADESR